ncbi:U2 small nuclear ribonucleoprotein auxiliary factor 35 kDa subunit-related protein 2 isoform X2 [Armigeres subalbatus]|uniref:U2 small nuclear ribonucleoprotein auxiliary factor 35 kDa subunit-related protein 2 isoform X2 n=1 Tax=Armigeres subalbatus TaxID=124917 RepID=UPI002ED07EC2
MINTQKSSNISHKEWRKLRKKLRRKRIRQKISQSRDNAAAEAEELRLLDPDYVAYLREKELLEFELLQQQEERRRYENALWMDREKEAQADFAETRRKMEVEQQEEKEKRERIRKEFEEMERKARDAKAEKERLMEEFRKKQQERERMFAEYLVGIDDHLPTLCESVHSRPGGNACVFFKKVGACRYGARCSSDHATPGLSELLLLPNFFAHPALDHQQHPEYGLDSSIEFDDDELYRCYKEFFFDIIEEFESFGKIAGIFVTRNYEPHLRGNVYVQYAKLRDAAKSYHRMKGRFYASKQLRVEFRSPITWTAAVCGKLNETIYANMLYE